MLNDYFRLIRHRFLYRVPCICSNNVQLLSHWLWFATFVSVSVCVCVRCTLDTLYVNVGVASIYITKLFSNARHQTAHEN